MSSLGCATLRSDIYDYRDYPNHTCPEYVDLLVPVDERVKTYPSLEEELDRQLCLQGWVKSLLGS